MLELQKNQKAQLRPFEQGSWQEIEPYITENTSSRLSHGVCPQCFAVLYPRVTIKEDGGRIPARIDLSEGILLRKGVP